ncbi:NAD-dependent epimerase/dehydratase family protein, partial [Candidatus Woesearchaeota archaeon]|nr:NAD-dependent epimerase/dehydratase family protein [Candidatus Woesearchaeota archaeon]
PLFITNLIDGEKVPLYGDGKNVRDWLHVQDHCEAVDLILHYGRIGETYCIGGGDEISNRDLTNIIVAMFDYGSEMIKHVEDRKGHDLRYSIDSTKISEELGWMPKHDFIEGLDNTKRWYEQNEAWWRPLK